MTMERQNALKIGSPIVYPNESFELAFAAADADFAAISALPLPMDAPSFARMPHPDKMSERGTLFSGVRACARVAEKLLVDLVDVPCWQLMKHKAGAHCKTLATRPILPLTQQVNTPEAHKAHYWKLLTP